MATKKETITYILEKLENDPHFFARAMFGEYALYADGKVVALVCDDILYVKIMPVDQKLDSICKKASPYPGAKLHYVITEAEFTIIENLGAILLTIAAAIPTKVSKFK